MQQQWCLFLTKKYATKLLLRGLSLRGNPVSCECWVGAPYVSLRQDRRVIPTMAKPANNSDSQAASGGGWGRGAPRKVRGGKSRVVRSTYRMNHIPTMYIAPVLGKRAQRLLPPLDRRDG